MKYLIIIALLTASQAFAHPGNTTYEGWHNNYATGDFHRHKKTRYSSTSGSGYRKPVYKSGSRSSRSELSGSGSRTK